MKTIEIKPKPKQSMKVIQPPKTKEDLMSIKHQKIRRLSHKKEYSKFSLDYYKEVWKYKFHKKKLFMIIMLLRNGNYQIFTTATTGRYFEISSGSYFLDQDMARRDLQTGFNVLFYHQDCAIPFKIDFNIDELMEKVSKGDVGDSSIVKALNPSSFRGFIDSEVIEKVLKGQELSDQLRKMYMLIIINVVISVIMIVVVVKGQGWI